MATDGTRVCNTNDENELVVVDDDDAAADDDDADDVVVVVSIWGGFLVVHVSGESPSKSIMGG